MEPKMTKTLVTKPITRKKIKQKKKKNLMLYLITHILKIRFVLQCLPGRG